MNTIKIIDLVKPPLERGKSIFMRFDQAAVNVDSKYYFERDQDINSNIITGIDVGYYSDFYLNYPNFISIDGVLYRTIRFADLSKTSITLCDNNGRQLMTRCPISFFRFDLTSERPRYDLRINIGTSFIQFNSTPLVTGLPMVIPFNFFWDND